MTNEQDFEKIEISLLVHYKNAKSVLARITEFLDEGIFARQITNYETNVIDAVVPSRGE